MLVSLEFLKAAFGWTDENCMNHGPRCALRTARCNFCIQVRYALGYRNLGERHFDLRTLYNFRQRLARHMAETCWSRPTADGRWPLAAYGGWAW